jgi:tRNA (Thr-GGU) A37 N-methylase
VVWAESLAENPGLADTPSMLAASTTREQKRPNPINSSPAEIIQLEFFELKHQPTP